jgi:hypothetical protein
MRLSNLLFTIGLTLLSLLSDAAVLSGTVLDESNNSIPFAIVEVINEDQKVMADAEGKYVLELSNGKHDIKISALGFLELVTSVKISNSKKSIKDFILKENSKELGAIEIRANSRDLAKEVMQQAIDKRSEFEKKYRNLSFDMYERVSLKQEEPDTTEVKPDSTGQELSWREKTKIIQQRSLIESFSKVVTKDPRQYKENILAYRNYSDVREYRNLNGGIQMDIGEPDITPQQSMYADPYLYTSNYAFREFDINKSFVELPALCEKNLLSPIGLGAFMNYKFDVQSITYRNNKKVYIIKVTPIYKVEPLFAGTITIEDESFAILEYDLSVNPLCLYFHESFRVQQFNKEIEPGVFVAEKRQVEYVIQDGRKVKIFGDLTIEYANLEVNPYLQETTFSDEVQTYDDLAFDRDSAYWQPIRQVEFNDYEKRYIHKCDSLKAYYVSEEFYEKQDSNINNLNVWDYLLNGITHINRKKDWMFYINPLILQLNIFGIGGYRHRLGGTFQKEFKNNYLLETEGDIDYGFANRDIRGKAGVGLTYFPKKFVRTFVRFGDYYDMINNYASIGSIFSRSNYVRSQTFSIAQRMEVINGLFAEMTFDFSDQRPINNLNLEQWSSDLFGGVNTPIEFERYTKFEIRLDVKYHHRQKYIIKKGKKLLLGSKYPVVSFNYRKGIPTLFNSEVNFDYVEIGLKHTSDVARIGQVDWSILAGSFVNRSNLRVLEYKYFRGSDAIFFSDPLRSFQLLGPTLSTPNAFYRGNYFQHFNGLILNKIPLINRLKLTEAAGAAFIAIPNQNFAHAEIYLGLEKVFRIKQQIFRVGVYGCTSDSSLDKANYEFKIGFNFYNTYSKKWSY